MTRRPVPQHYPYITRMLLELFDSGALSNVVAVEVEPEYGYATQIVYKSKAVRMTYGNDAGLNLGAATEVVRDKGHAKHFLTALGVACPRGRTFLLPHWADQIRDGLASRAFTDLRVSHEAAAYASGELGFPVYVKPVNGSRGAGVWRCASEQEVQAALMAIAQMRSANVVLVEEAIDLPDHRLVVLEGRVISAYTRRPLAVVGDGVSTIAELLQQLSEDFLASGRDTRIDTADPRIALRLQRAGLTFQTRLEHGQELDLIDISNLSAGGTAVDLTRDVADRWRELAWYVTRQLGLRMAGIDLACADLTAAEGPYSILEVNSTPGLDHYASVGAPQEQLVRELYTELFNTVPSVVDPTEPEVVA